MIKGGTVKLQFSGLGWSAAKGPLFWSCPLFLDLFMYYFLKMVTEKSPVKWSYPLFLESAKLEFNCTYRYMIPIITSKVFSIFKLE